MSGPIPALIVGGYLGSGKTTLVGHLLREAQSLGIRLAIVSNEFGDTGIDQALLDNGEDGFVELDGGCVCCKLSDALSETVEAVLDRARPDRLLLELSGVALPGEVLIQFWRPPLSERISSARVVVVVDAPRARALADDETWLAQLEAADAVVLSKTDLADDADARRLVAAHAPDRPLFPARFGAIDREVLWPAETAPQETVQRERASQAHSHEMFTSRSLTFPGVVDGEDVLRTIAALAPIRAKGFIRTADGVRVVQGVGEALSLSVPAVPPPESLVGMVVVIDKGAGRVAH